MLFDFTDGVLYLRNCELRSSQKSQLRYWGFKINEKGYEKEINKNDKILSKVFNFFINENTSFSLSNSCQELLNDINKSKKNFEDILSVGKAYKNCVHAGKEVIITTSRLKNISKRSLKAHQLKAATHLYLVQNGANFSVPGSGKTAVALCVYGKLRLEGKVNTLFVVGPPSCFQPWIDEFKITLNRTPEYQILAGGNPNLRKSLYFVAEDKKPELYLSTFQTLLKDHQEVITFMRRRGIDIFSVIDEAHYIKKIEGNWATTILDLAKYAKFRCVLTGTPMPKSYADIYNLFDFLWPENNPIDINGKIRMQELERRNEFSKIKDILKTNIGPLFYRVRKSDLGLRPAILHEPIIVPMHEYEKKLYDIIENRIIEHNKEDYMKNTGLIRRLRRGRMIRLRQCTSYVKLLSTAIEDYDEDLLDSDPELIKIITNYDNYEVPAKLEYVLKFVQRLKKSKDKVIIWSNFIKTIELLQATLTKNNHYCKLIYGKTPIERELIKDEETREKIRKEFLDPLSGLDILIANPAACAESISLHTTCHKALYYDLSYNCAQYLQSLDRIHRVGGSEKIDTHYFFLQYENTIDKDIAQNLDDKAKRMNDLIEEDYSIYTLDMVDENEDEQAYKRLFLAKKKK
ncbi:MAG: DEAD/DEAH box helicase [Nanoarchaeota archaeon]|nr:DEAD/DEAH box helicase [Nanoarchaeota archaeon]